MAKTSARQLHIQARRAFVLAERKRGATFRAIAESAGEFFKNDKLFPKTYDHAAAWLDLKNVIEQTWEKTVEDARAVLLLELMRLDDLTAGLWQRATSGDEDAVEQVLKIMQRRDAYMGLSEYGPRYFSERMGEEATRDRNAIEGIYKVVKVTKSYEALEVSEDDSSAA